MWRLLAVLWVVVVCFATSGSGQTLLHEFRLPGSEQFGDLVGSPGDVNHDGYADVMVAGSGSCGYLLSASLRVYSGLTGDALHEFRVFSCNPSAAVGDLDGDGQAEHLVGSPWFGLGGNGRVDLYSGITGQRTWIHVGDVPQFDSFGRALAVVGDVDLDGCADYLISGSQQPGFLYSGRTRRPLYPVSHGDAAVAVGDMSGDRIPDYVITDPVFRASGRLSAGKVDLYSGADGTLLRTFEGANANDFFGSSVAAADLDGDQVPELVVGIPRRRGLGTAPGDGNGRVEVYSGDSGALLLVIAGNGHGDRFGHSVAAGGDVDGDGTSDYVVGAPDHPLPGNDRLVYGAVFVYSGRSNALLFQQDPTSTGREFGHAVACEGDVDGDGRDDVIVGDPRHSDGGVAHVFSFDRPLAR